MAGRRAGSARSQYWLELAATLILSLATVGSAYSAWRSSWWGSIHSAESAQAAYLQTESVRASNLYNATLHIDSSSWIAWLEAMHAGEGDFADFLARHFRAEFRASFESWLALPPEDLPAGLPRVPAGSPFTSELYRSTARDQAALLQAQSEAAEARSRTASTIATKFVLTVVIYASVLFMAGLSLKVNSQDAKVGLLVVASCLLVAALAFSALVPTLFGMAIGGS